MDEMTFGMDFDQYEADRGSEAPKAGVHRFRIVSTSDLTTQQKGDNEGSRCFNAWCEVLGEDNELTGIGMNKFCGFGTKKDQYNRTQIGDMIRFAEDIGRKDILRNDATPDELVGTEFEGTVKISKKGNPYFADYKPLCSDEDAPADEPADEPAEATAEEATDDTPPPQAARRKGRR